MHSLRLHLFFLTLCALCAFIGMAYTQSAWALGVKNVRFGTYPDKTRLVFDLTDTTKFRAFALSNPYRLVLDLPAFTWDAATVDRPAGSNVTAVRHGTLKPGISRVVFDLSQPIAIKTAFVLPKQNNKPHRLVLDYSATSAATFEENAKGRVFGDSDLEAPPPPTKNIEATHTQETRQKPAKKPIKKATIKHKPIIVIDPGHGGVDPGAIGANKVYEKHVVLALSQALKKELDASGKYKVLITRNSDKFIKLHERVKFARKHNADLFVSVHADSIEKKNVRGASFYTLSEKASDKQTARLAARENQADLIAGIDLSHEDKDVANILVDLAIRDTTNQGKFFANKVVDSFKNSGIRVLENPHRHAGFAVLKAPDIPSILVEAGFMSNKKEASLLNTSSYRRKVAKALKNGIDTYFKQIEKNQR